MGRPRRLPPRRPRRRPDGRSSLARVAPYGRRSAMTTLAHRTKRGGGWRHGAVAARRALVRWSGRHLRRSGGSSPRADLLSVSVAAAIGSITTGRLQRGSRRRRRLRLGQSRAQRRVRPAQARCGARSPPRSRSERSTSSATARCGCPGLSRPSTTDTRSRRLRRELLAPAAVATRLAAIRSPSPTGLRALCGSRSGRSWQSTGASEPSWASSRTRAS